MSKIQALSKNDIHRICSGQAIVDLGTSVKELVENALDAGATKVDIRLKDHGLGEISVFDNGKGVNKENHATLCLKHHTSKIEHFEDLTALTSFGFRGEALSSLCGLADLEITTRTKGDDIGTLLKFSRQGALVHQEVKTRSVGTTVAMKKLFHTLPVRHREFKKHVKREYNKMLSVMQAYAIIVKGVQITLTNSLRTKNNRAINVGNTKKLKDRIGAVYDYKTVKILDEINAEFNCGISMKGFASHPSHKGRGSPDRQHFFLNSRPVDVPKIQRIINSVFKRFRKKQYPFLCLNFKLGTETYDVNVDPNKRAVFIHRMSDLIEEIEKYFESIWDAQTHTFEAKKISSIFQVKKKIPKETKNTTTENENKSEESQEKKKSKELRDDIKTEKEEKKEASKIQSSSPKNLSNNLIKLKRPGRAPGAGHICFFGCNCQNPADPNNMRNAQLAAMIKKKKKKKRKEKMYLIFLLLAPLPPIQITPVYFLNALLKRTNQPSLL